MEKFFNRQLVKNCDGTQHVQYAVCRNAAEDGMAWMVIWEAASMMVFERKCINRHTFDVIENMQE